MAAAFAAFDAEVAPRIPADALPLVSLEDLRLQTPALRPVGCWWSGCAQPAPPAGTPPVALAVLLQAQQEQSVLVLGPRDALAPLLVALSLCLRVRTRWCWTRLSCDPPQAQDRERPNGVLVLFVESSLAQPSQRRHCAFSERRCKSANRGEERQCAPQWW